MWNTVATAQNRHFQLDKKNKKIKDTQNKNSEKFKHLKQMSITNVWYAFTNFDLTWYHVRIAAKISPYRYRNFLWSYSVLFSRLTQWQPKINNCTTLYTHIILREDIRWNKKKKSTSASSPHAQKVSSLVQIKIIVCTNRRCNEQKNPKFKMFSNTYCFIISHRAFSAQSSSNFQFMFIIMSDKR